jgi:glutamate synthase (NADPH/NADH) large chain
MKQDGSPEAAQQVAERDGCAIIGYIKKHGLPTHGNLQRTIDALIKMGHRAGEIRGEGDGCGVLTDIPRLLWRELLANAGLDPDLAEDPAFAVAHLLLPAEAAEKTSPLRGRILELFAAAGLRLLLERPCPVRSEVLSSSARKAEPFFWQLAFHAAAPEGLVDRLYDLHMALESDLAVHVASLSARVASYKVLGAPELLARYYPDLKRRDFLSAVTIGHSRFSTNTLPNVLRAQPFSLLGHNGEINTIQRLREEAQMLGIFLPPGGSDSQDLNRILEGLIRRYGLTLFEAMEMVFPAIFSSLDGMPPELRSLYLFSSRMFRASAQ